MKTRKITLAGMMIALATVLSMVKLFEAPYGGSVTAGSMVPIILFSMLVPAKWGIAQAVCYGIIQLLLGWYAPPVQSALNFVLVILLDYIIAFGGLGLAGALGRKSGKAAAAVGTFCALLIRFLCHFASGILIWSSFAPEGQPVWLYSLLYNGGYMLCEAVITMAAVLLIRPRLAKWAKIS